VSLVDLSPLTEPRTNRIYLLFGRLLLLVLAGVGPGCSADSEASPRGRRAKVEPRVVIEEGVLEPVRCMSVMARTRGQITWICPEGKTVEKGERVLELDHESRLRDLDNREVALEEARARVTQLEDAFADQVKDLEQEVKTAESTLALARLNLKILRDGPTPGARAEAKARLEKARAAHETACETHDRMKGLFERGVASEDEKHLKWVEMERARLAHEMEKRNWEFLVRGPERVTLAKALQDIEVGKLDVEVATERQRSQVAQLKSGIEEAKLQVERIQDEVRRTRRRIDQSVLRAPGRGLVVYGMVGHGRKTKIDVGARVWPGSALITLPDLRAFKVTTQVSEAIVGGLRPGQRVTVAFPTIDGATFTGEIVHIDVWGQDRNELLDETGKEAEGLYGTKVYRVDVQLLEKDPRMNLGIKARVRFPVEAPPPVRDPMLEPGG